MKRINLTLLFAFFVFSNLFAQNEVKIGEQIWMTKNLNVDKFRNGKPIPQAKTKEEWNKAGQDMTPAWCYYNFDPNNGIKYGKLYNWFAVIDPMGLAPIGYHIPTDNEWHILIKNMDTSAEKCKFKCFESRIAGREMKSSTGWKANQTYGHTEVEVCGLCNGKGKRWSKISMKYIICTGCGGSGGESIEYKGTKESGGGTNTFAFSALPAGRIWGNGGFDLIQESSYWWSSTEKDVLNAWFRDIGYNNTTVLKDDTDKSKGMSVRCIKD